MVDFSEKEMAELVVNKQRSHPEEGEGTLAERQRQKHTNKHMEWWQTGEASRGR